MSTQYDKRIITCIACPIGCRLEVSRDRKGSIAVEKNGCARGVTYGKQEFTAPVRMVTSSVRVLGGAEPLAAVRTAQPIPKEKVKQALTEIREIKLPAPLSIGDMILENLAGTGVKLIVSRGVERLSS